MEWVSIKDKLPNNDDYVLIVHKFGTAIGFFSKDNKWHSKQFPKNELKTVSFWCNIPELPIKTTKREKSNQPRRITKTKDFPQNILCAVFGQEEYENIIQNSELCLVNQRFEKMLNTLTDREKKVIFLRWECNYSMAKAGKYFGLSAERIRQIECKIFRKLRFPTRAEFIKTGRDVEAEKQKRLQEIMKQKEEKYRNLEFDKIKIEELDFSVRPFNILKRAGYNTLKDLLLATDDDLRKIRNLGPHSFNEIKDKLKKYMEAVQE